MGDRWPLAVIHCYATAKCNAAVQTQHVFLQMPGITVFVFQ
jgi:hypothetical protein